MNSCSGKKVGESPFIPPDAHWFVADVVMETKIEGWDKNIVNINLLLVEASNPEDAFERALQLGRDHEITYTNTDDKAVAVTFRGLRDLGVVHGQLVHGAELLYECREDVSEREMQSILTPKAELGVFMQR